MAWFECYKSSSSNSPGENVGTISLIVNGCQPGGGSSLNFDSLAWTDNNHNCMNSLQPD